MPKKIHTIQNTNLISMIEKIAKKSAANGLKFKQTVEMPKEISILTDFLQITPVEAVLFSVIVELSLTRHVNFEELSSHFRCSPLKIIGMMNEIETLIKKGLINKVSRSRGGDNSINNVHFQIAPGVIEMMLEKNPEKMIRTLKFDLPKFLEKISNMTSEREHKQISTRQFISSIEELISNNRDLDFVNYVDKQLIKTVNKSVTFLLAFTILTSNRNYEISELSDIIFDDITERFSFQQEIIQQVGELWIKEFITLQPAEFFQEKTVKLTKKVISKLYSGHMELQVQDFNDSNFIKPDNIKFKQLYFNSCLQTDILNLEKTLIENNYNRIKKQLEQRQFNTGMTILFHGYSGTGKTEVVYQLARKTKRNIMMVDLSETKSKWFGDSEKKVKQIFDDYRLALRDSRITPILFINEADGLFSKRQDIGTNATSATQALNTMQNILLQELESFTGILLATTNLTGNLDKAFDRRFLIKLNFTHPDTNSRNRIWKNRLPELSTKQRKLFSSKYELTGGQIENIIRQSLLTQMVDNKIDIVGILHKNCEQEAGYNKIKSIGF